MFLGKEVDSKAGGKEVDSKTGAGKIQDEPEISCDIRKDICAKRACQNDTRTNLKKLPVAKAIK